MEKKQGEVKIIVYILLHFTSKRFIRFVVKTRSSINMLLKFKDNYLQAKEQNKMYQILFIYWNQVIFSQIQSWKRLFVIGLRSHKKPYIIILNVTKNDLNIFNIFCSALAEIRCFKVYFDKHGKDILWLIIRLHNFIILTTVWYITYFLWIKL